MWFEKNFEYIFLPKEYIGVNAHESNTNTFEVFWLILKAHLPYIIQMCIVHKLGNCNSHTIK